VIFETKYGNTRAVGEAMAEVLRDSVSLEVVVARVGAVDMDALAGADLIIVGSPNHMGSHMRGIKKLMKRMGKMDLKGKRVAFFDTCVRGSEGDATQKMVTQLESARTGAELSTPGLSTVVTGMRGPLAEGALDEARKFARRILAEMTT
jgi:flavodoxin